MTTPKGIETEEPAYRSPALRSLHKTASALHRAGLFTRQTMREFDVSCLTAVEPLNAEEIRTIRDQAELSQAAFAMVLNVTKDQVSKWERGEKKPSGPSLKLLTLAHKKGVEAIL